MTSVASPSEVGSGQIVSLAFEDGKNNNYMCGLEDCECPDHEADPAPRGTYVTIRLDDEDADLGFWQVDIKRREVSS